MTIVRGDFGIGDSPNGHLVKDIRNTTRCKTLKVNDVLHEINGINVKEMSHVETVKVLRDCPNDKEIKIVVQRRGNLGCREKKAEGVSITSRCKPSTGVYIHPYHAW